MGTQNNFITTFGINCYKAQTVHMVKMNTVQDYKEASGLPALQKWTTVKLPCPLQPLKPVPTLVVDVERLHSSMQ